MSDESQAARQIEELRRRLHLELGSTYDPLRIQLLVPISQELDRLVVQEARIEELALPR